MAHQILLGTTKGAFILRHTDAGKWIVSGPHCEGWPINHIVGDPDTGDLWAGGGGPWFGAGMFHSADSGESWTKTRLSSGMMDEWAANDPEFAEMIGWSDAPLPFGKEMEQVWSMHCAHGNIYAGTKPAQLLMSDDHGATWQDVSGVSEHPTRADWNGGAAGLVLHTIVTDPGNPSKMWIGISAAGVFATEDNGKTWERRNRLSNTQVCEGHTHPAAPANGDVGHCVHNMQRANGDNDILYQQNHHGVWRSADGGRSWDDVTTGLPSTFGFPIGVHPNNPDIIWTIPLNGDSQGRYPPDAKAAVWKSADGGKTWVDKRDGLPQEGCFFTVLRQAMAVDQTDEAGVFFGTNTGSVFASFDEGETWDEIARHLPTILSVETLNRG